VSTLIRDAVSLLASTPVRWAALAGIAPELLARGPAPGEWSARQCLAHVVDTERSVFRARVLAILTGQNFAAFDPDADGADTSGVSARDLAGDFVRLRAESLDTLAGITEADLVKTAVHAELGRVTMAELLNQLAAHDTMHLVQAERALMQAFIPGSGPWRFYFGDHDVDAKP